MPLSHKLLLIDDDKVGVSLLAETFKSQGFLVQTALTGVEGIRLAEEWRPNLIILDLMMPEMDGFAVCRMLQSRPATANIQILTLTARTEKNYMVNALNLGADDYLTKPYSVTELLARVKARLRDFKENHYQCEVSITYDTEQILSCRISGAMAYNGDGRRVSLNLSELNQELIDMGDRMTAFQQLWAENSAPNQREVYREKRDVWKRQAKKKGRELYDQIIASNSDLVTQLRLATDKLEAENVPIRFIGPRAYLGFPWEFLHDGQRGPLAILHPTSRLISGLSLRAKQEPWNIFLKSLGAHPLRVLLLASSAGIPLEEIKWIAQCFKQELGEGVVISPDPPSTLSQEQAEKLLASKSHHLIHYAGHSQFNARQPDRSGLRFGPGAGDVITAGRL
jgi:DNA-binding response OmpR family regulator